MTRDTTLVLNAERANEPFVKSFVEELQRRLSVYAAVYDADEEHTQVRPTVPVYDADEEHAAVRPSVPVEHGQVASEALCGRACDHIEAPERWSTNVL